VSSFAHFSFRFLFGFQLLLALFIKPAQLLLVAVGVLEVQVEVVHPGIQLLHR
jgi:hypothetical protein